LYITGNENDFFVGPNTYGATGYVVKCDLNGNVGNCPTQQYPMLHTDNYNFSEGINTLNVNDAALSITATSASVTNYYPDVYDNCVSVSICDSLHLKANNFTCTPDPIYITGVRNIGCSSPIAWNVTPSSGFDFQNNNDSTASLAFNKSGLYKVTGSITRQCGDTIKDSMLIHVNLSANIDLGRDTFLCTGNTIVLHAGNQFSSYKWQDGSTDSVYAVTAAGKYYIDVTDFCNNTYSDTINVAAGPDYHFHINNTSKCNNDSILLVAPDGFSHYTWTPNYDITGDTGRAVKVFPEIDTSYIVTAEISGGCYIHDTIQITVNHSAKIFLGNDTTLCDGLQLILNAGNGFINYAWNSGETTSHIIAVTADTFWVTATANNGCVSSDTLVMKSVYALPVFSLGNDTVLCQKQYLRYNFNLPGVTYLWDSGSTSSERMLDTEGSYWLGVTRQACSSTDSINLSYKPLPFVNLGNDTTLCEGMVKTLDAENINAVYQWQDLSTASIYTVSSPGTYYVSVMVNNCTNSDTVNIHYMSKPSFSFGATPFLCSGEQIILSPEVNAEQTFLWQDGSNSPSLAVKQQGIYTLTVTNECGSYTNSITISQGNCALEMPNAFTPNNDGSNDVFRVKYPGFIKSFHMMIFNRFGDKVFETYDPTKGWDGKLNSEDQPIGAYVWIINLIRNNNTPQNSKGTITLLR
jgi:gliding motility-associated-like protein